MEKINVKELKKGDVIYNVEYNEVSKITYLCVHPNNKKYHIVLDQNQDPYKIFEPKLQAILDRGIESYTHAHLILATQLEDRAKFLRTLANK